MKEVLPQKAQQSSQKNGKNTARRCQSLRPESSAAAKLASMPGIIAPYSWPKLPRIPQPMESESPTQRIASRPGLAGMPARVVSGPTETDNSPIAKLIAATLIKLFLGRNANGKGVLLGCRRRRKESLINGLR